MVLSDIVDSIPIAKGPDGVIRVGGTRVTLDTIIHAFQRGRTAEEIAQSFPAVSLCDIYQVIGYYLKHRDELDPYLTERQQQQDALIAENIDRWSPVGFREQLLARRPKQ